jgi:hypothetical protein
MCLAADAFFCNQHSTKRITNSNGELVRRGVKAFSDRVIVQVINGVDRPLTKGQLHTLNHVDEYELEGK